MFKSMRRKLKAEQALMQKVNEATKQGSCVILSQTPEGTRIIVIGQPLVLRQAEEILRNKGEDID